jgi:hypothetical protein
MAMFSNPILFPGPGLSWTLARCCVAAGLLLMLLGALLFLILFKHVRGKVERLSPEEAGELAANAARRDVVPTIRMKGVGVSAQLSFNIDTLRQAARRGDWLTFWLAPGMFVVWFIGVWLMCMAFAIAEGSRAMAVVVSVFMTLLVLVPPFMSWAAIYTTIDMDTDGPAGSAPPSANRD